MSTVGVRSQITAFLCTLVLGILTSAGTAVCGGEGDPVSYAGIAPEKYLTGRFDPVRTPGFVELSTLGIPVKGERQYLRREAAEALAAMYRDFSKAYPGIDFRVRSSTRNWDRQKAIWESKWRGHTPVGGARLNETIVDSAARSLKILEFSSMPGTSRHHWGTDFDLQALDNGYYESGAGRTLYLWLIANAHSYGFCQPYTAGRSAGYLEEKWHWSYMPLARDLLADWIRIFKNSPERIVEEGGFAGSDFALPLATLYVESVNQACR